jgi:hypothetical protein
MLDSFLRFISSPAGIITLAGLIVAQWCFCDTLVQGLKSFCRSGSQAAASEGMAMAVGFAH